MMGHGTPLVHVSAACRQKPWISTANRMHDIQHADRVGLQVESKIDHSQVMQHVTNFRDRFTHTTLKTVESWPESS